MSWETQAWARRVRTGNPGRKTVLLVLAEFADEADSCYPSQATIAEGTELSVRTVRERLAELEEMGFIRRERRGKLGGGRNSDRYYLQTKEANLAGLPDQSGEMSDQTGEDPDQSGALLPTNTTCNNYVDLKAAEPKNEESPPMSKEDIAKAKAVLQASKAWSPPAEAEG